MGTLGIFRNGLCILSLLLIQQAQADLTYSIETHPYVPEQSCPGPCPPGDSQCALLCKEQENSIASQNSDSCSQALENLIAKCDKAVTSAERSCDEKNDAGLNSVSSQAASMTLAIGQQTASSIQAACSGVAALAQAANAALAAYRMSCSNFIGSCKSSCSAAVQYYQDHNGCEVNGVPQADNSILSYANNQLNRCLNFTVNTQQAQQAIMNYGLTSSNASQCASLTSSGDNSISAICAANPKLPGCSNKVVDCSDPTMAANRVCLCANHPGDPQCVGAAVVTADSKIVSTDMSSRLATHSVSSRQADTPSLPQIEQSGFNNDVGGASAVDGKQGSGAALGGSGISSSSGSQRSAARGIASVPANGSAVYAGFGSVTGRSGGRSNNGSEERRGSLGRLWNRFTKAIGSNKPDLRQFLPGGRLDPNRGVAGTSGPDGITGPHSNIWEKVQNRYKVVSPSLIP